MALIFPNTGLGKGLFATDFTVAFSQDFAIRLPDITLPDTLFSQIIIGQDTLGGLFISLTPTGNLRIRCGGDHEIGPFSAGQKITNAVIRRVSQTLTLSADGVSSTVVNSNTSNFNVNNYGTYNNDSLNFRGALGGVCVFELDGVEVISHDFEQPKGSASMPDTIGTSDVTLIGFAESGSGFGISEQQTILADTGIDTIANTFLSGGTAPNGRDFLDTTNTITDSGSFESISIKIDNTTDVNLTIKVFRDNGANYDYVGKSQTFSILSEGVNNLIFDTAIPVLAGDLICFHLAQTTTGGHLGVADGIGATIWSNSDNTINVPKASFNNTLPSSRGVVFEAVGTVTTPANSLNIDDKPYQQIWQRTASENATVTIDGTYTGIATAIERRIDGGAWTTAIASPTDNVFSDTFTLTTGEHTIDYRLSNDISITAILTPVVVGDIYVCAGQSNISGRGTNNQVFSVNPSGTNAYLFGNDDEFGVLVDPYDSSANQVDVVSADSNPAAAGSWIPRFAHYLLQNEDAPIAFIPCAKGGTNINQWARSTAINTLYGSMKRRVDLIQGCKTVLWQQGEADATSGTNTPLATYESAMNQLANDIASDFGVKTWIVPLHTINPTNYPNQNNIRQAQINAAVSNANIEIVQPLTDIDVSDGDYVHFRQDNELDSVGFRVWQSMSDITPPVITVTPNNQTITVGQPIPTFTATAIDDRDGDITANIVESGDTIDNQTAGTYVRRWNVQDSAGNAATEVVRTVNVIVAPDVTPPVITLNGSNPVTISQGSTYTDAGATAVDNVDGVVAVTTSGTVNTNTVGLYTITYSATDVAGNTATATRTVNVIAVSQTDSILNLSITGIPNGLQPLKLWSETDNSLVFNGNVSFNNQSASITVPNTPSGTILTGRWLGNNPPTTGTGIYGVTE